MKLALPIILGLTLANPSTSLGGDAPNADWTDQQRKELAARAEARERDRQAWLKQRAEQREEHQRQLEAWRNERKQERESQQEDLQRHAELRRKQQKQYEEWAKEQRKNYLRLKRSAAAY